MFPYTRILTNAWVSFLIGLVTIILLHKNPLLPMESSVVILLLVIGGFTTLSSLHLVMSLAEQKNPLIPMLLVFMANAGICGLMSWLGLLIGNQT